MADLRQQIESLPPGLILIKGREQVAEFLHALPRNVLTDLHRLGYRFFVVPEGIALEAMPDEVLEKLWLERQAARVKATVPTPTGVH